MKGGLYAGKMSKNKMFWSKSRPSFVLNIILEKKTINKQNKC